MASAVGHRPRLGKKRRVSASGRHGACSWAFISKLPRWCRCIARTCIFEDPHSVSDSLAKRSSAADILRMFTGSLDKELSAG